MTLNKFTQNLVAERPKLYCAITLDDCIKRDVDIAINVINKTKVPITLYLPTFYSEKRLSMWPIKIIEVINQSNAITFNGNTYLADTLKKKLKIKTMMIDYFLSLHEQTNLLEERVDAWMKDMGFDNRNIPENLRVIGFEEVRKLSKNRYVDIESHTSTHPFLSLLNEDEINNEFLVSKNIIKKHTSNDVSSLCFPYGSKEAVGKKSVAIAGNYYKNATTLIQGVCGRKTSLYYMPRIGIYPGDKGPALFSKIYHYQTKNIFN